MNIGRIKGVCSTSCRYDSDGACSRCGGLDPERWIVAAWRVPSEAEEKHGKALAAFADVAVSLGLDPAILSLRAGDVSDSSVMGEIEARIGASSLSPASKTRRARARHRAVRSSS